MTSALAPRVSRPRGLPANTKWAHQGLGALVHAAGLTLEQLAAVTGFTPWHLRLVFVGRRLPTVELLLRLQKALGVDGGVLLEACRPQINAHLRNKGLV
jgi:transcriptional regulator with XRE-family HTH domain